MKKITLLFMMLLMVTFGFSQTELVTNGDFESSLDPAAWYGNAFNIVTQGSNRLNEADVQTAGQVFSVNLSQEIVLDDGKKYKVTFDSFTDATTGSRDIVFGLGQTGAPFNALTETVTISSSSQTFTKEFTINYGNAVTDRVLFDIGGAVGFVFIDNVSVVEVENTCNNGIQDGDETGVDCGGSCAPCPPDTAAPTPPNRAAADVISIYSDAYTDISVNTFDTDWCPGTTTEVTIAGNATKRVTGLGCEGIDWQSARTVDASQMTHFHIDIWTDSETLDKSFNMKFSNWAGGTGEANAIEFSATNASNPALPNPNPGTWISFDIPLSDWTSGDISDIVQFVITSDLGAVYYDNLYLHKNTTLSNNEFAQAEFKAYPNPTQDVWNIKTTENIKNVQVFNMTGRLVRDMNVNASEAVINTNGLSSGIYLAKISNDADQTKTIKLIKE